MVVKLKPTWTNTTKAGNDATGWKRGARGIDGAFDADGRDFMKTADPKADAFMYGKQTRNVPADGAQRVLSNAADPGTITNKTNRGTSSGYDGVDE